MHPGVHIQENVVPTIQREPTARPILRHIDKNGRIDDHFGGATEGRMASHVMRVVTRRCLPPRRQHDRTSRLRYPVGERFWILSYRFGVFGVRVRGEPALFPLPFQLHFGWGFGCTLWTPRCNRERAYHELVALPEPMLAAYATHCIDGS